MDARPGVNLPKTKRGEATFDKILEAAEEVFGEKGYHEASVTAITERAGIGNGTFYLYFKTKKDVFQQLIEHLHYNIKQRLSRLASGLQDRAEVEAVGLRAFHEYIVEHKDLYKLIREAEAVDEDLFKWYYQEFAKSYTKQLQAAMDGGKLRPMNPEALAYCLIGINVFTGMRWSVWEGREAPEEMLDTIVDFILYGLKGGGQNEGTGDSRE